MQEMILKMSAVTGIQVLLVILLWLKFRNRKLSIGYRIIIGLVFGGTAVLSTHFGVDYNMMLVNARDLGPLAAGLFFDPVSGIIAGLIGGIERFIAGTFWNIGVYTCIACSISTCMAGILSAVLRAFLFRGKNPSVVYAFFIGAVMEVFHMYSVFLTHRDDMTNAFYVVRTCSAPMILFTAVGLAMSGLIISIISGKIQNILRRRKEGMSISTKFQFWLFLVTLIVMAASFLLSHSLQTASAVQNARDTLNQAQAKIRSSYEILGISEKNIYEFSNKNAAFSQFQVGMDGSFDLINENGYIPIGDHRISILDEQERRTLKSHKDGELFEAFMFYESSLCLKQTLDDHMILLTMLPLAEVYAQRDQQNYETFFSVILLFAVIYIFASILAEKIVVSRINQINMSLDRITQGKLDEEVNVRSSKEFAVLSDDINQMVTALKGYIEAAKKRMAQELELARNIQESSLPRNFDAIGQEYSLYALMDPAREVGGDFYDFFFVEPTKLALVIADVSGKGIPAAMFMMRSKTAIRSLAGAGRSPSEILYHANNELCEGNNAEMFITVWIGIIDLDTGHMICANAGHEYPAIMKSGEDFQLLKDKHGLVLAAMEGSRFKDYELQLEPGDRLFVYTDGVPEAVNEQTEQYGTDRLIQTLNELKDLPVNEVVTAVRQDISEFAGDEEQFDDITIMEFIYR